jgi:predicted Zn-dependent protease
VIEQDFEAQFNLALKLRADGRPAAAIELLVELRAREQSRPAVAGMLGAILLYDLDNPAEALSHLLESSKLSPNSELASVALFHALFELERTGEAFDEMRRFMSNHRSEEYERLLTDINREET